VCVVRQLTVLLSGPLARKAPGTHDTETTCKNKPPPHVIPGTWLFFWLFDLRPGKEERSALGVDLLSPERDVLPTWEYTRVFRILYGLGPGNGEWELD
jgi:hypothetical protein